MSRRWAAGLAAVVLALLVLPTAAAEEATVPKWVVAPGSTLQYVYKVHDPDGKGVPQGSETWKVVGVSDDLVELQMSTDAEARAHLAGAYTVEIWTRTIRDAPSDLLVGNLFWLWIPDAEVGDKVRVWSTDYEVVPADEEGVIALRHYEGSSSEPTYESTLYYHEGTDTLVVQGESIRGEPDTTLGLHNVEMGTMERGDFAILTLLSGFTVIEFIVFFMLYRRYRKKIAAHETAPPVAQGFCGGCGTPRTGGAFCAGCGSPAVGSVVA